MLKKIKTKLVQS